MENSIGTAESAAATTKIIADARKAVQPASFEALMRKPRRIARFPITLADEDGEPVVYEISYQAVGPREFDDLVAGHPPTPKQKTDGASWNLETFAPALIAAVSAVPKLDVAQARALYANPNYASGEQRELFFQALDICGQGLNIPFTDGG